MYSYFAVIIDVHNYRSVRHLFETKDTAVDIVGQVRAIVAFYIFTLHNGFTAVTVFTEQLEVANAVWVVPIKFFALNVVNLKVVELKLTAVANNGLTM